MENQANSKEWLTKKEVAEIWATTPNRPISETTIWLYEKKGWIPKPLKVGRQNLYLKEKVIEYKNRVFDVQ